MFNFCFSLSYYNQLAVGQRSSCGLTHWPLRFLLVILLCYDLPQGTTIQQGYSVCCI